MKKIVKEILKTFNSQKGVMFGLDARIALAVFAGLSIVAGAAMTLNLSNVSGGALAKELKTLTASIEGIHNDIKMDLHSSLMVHSDENAFKALYDVNQIQPLGNIRAKWLGPYVEYRTNEHPKYGTISITKAGEPFTQNCRISTSICYLWIKMNAVSTPIVHHVNNLFDGDSELSPDQEGRVQWSGEGENISLYFRATRAMNRR